MSETVLTVTEASKLIKEYVEAPDYFRHLSIRGEVSNLTYNRSGHIYFSIKDETAALKCMIWKDRAEIARRWKLKEGMKVTCLGRLTFYIAGGSIGFEVRELTLEGKGELQQLYEERYEYLKVRGWFDESLKKALPRIPNRIGIITAATGAVIHDIISTMSRRYPLIEIYLFPVQVQGPQARYDIAKKINQANLFSPILDLIIVARGGGSYEDLWPFNELEVLEAVRKATIPIISAIGHEPDFTLIDYVSDRRAPTPTAAAELATPNLVELKQNLAWLTNEWQLNLNDLLVNRERWLKSASQFLSQKLQQTIVVNQQNLINLTNEWTQKTESLIINQERWLKDVNQFFSQKLNQMIFINEQNLISLYQNNLNKITLLTNYKANELDQLALKWNLVNPYNPLSKGYALMLNQAQQVITNLHDLQIGEKINLQAQEGTVEAQVRRILWNKK